MKHLLLVTIGALFLVACHTSRNAPNYTPEPSEYANGTLTGVDGDRCGILTSAWISTMLDLCPAKGQDPQDPRCTNAFVRFHQNHSQLKCRSDDGKIYTFGGVTQGSTIALPIITTQVAVPAPAYTQDQVQSRLEQIVCKAAVDESDYPLQIINENCNGDGCSLELGIGGEEMIHDYFKKLAIEDQLELSDQVKSDRDPVLVTLSATVDGKVIDSVTPLAQKVELKFHDQETWDANVFTAGRLVVASGNFKLTCTRP